MNANSKEKLRIIKARRKTKNMKQVSVIMFGAGLNPLEFLDADSKVIKVREAYIAAYN